ncbi:MAG: hypothetical protein P8M05_13175 [Flavobacteriales bacterium]|nr:hypothetical protein [Flavobacteriales bacterium]
MRLLIIILTFLSLIGCNDNGQKSDTQNDRLELVLEPDKDLREKYDQTVDTLSADTTYQEFMGESLRPIREKLKPLSNRQEWTDVDKRKIETEKGNGSAVYYFLKGELRKIRLLQNSDSTDRFVEYYLEDNDLFFVFERQTDNYELKNDPEFYEPFEDSLFFEKGELIRIKSNMDCGAPFAADYRKEEQDRLKTEFDKIINRLRI